jgi:hypothetical protein
MASPLAWRIELEEDGLLVVRLTALCLLAVRGIKLDVYGRPFLWRIGNLRAMVPFCLVSIRCWRLATLVSLWGNWRLAPATAAWYCMAYYGGEKLGFIPSISSGVRYLFPQLVIVILSIV